MSKEDSNLLTVFCNASNHRTSEGPSRWKVSPRTNCVLSKIDWTMDLCCCQVVVFHYIRICSKHLKEKASPSGCFFNVVSPGMEPTFFLRNFTPALVGQVAGKLEAKNLVEIMVCLRGLLWPLST